MEQGGEDGGEGVREEDGDKEEGVDDSDQDEVDESGGAAAKSAPDAEPDGDGETVAKESEDTEAGTEGSAAQPVEEVRVWRHLGSGRDWSGRNGPGRMKGAR